MPKMRPRRISIPDSMSYSPGPLPKVRRKLDREEFFIPSPGSESKFKTYDFNVMQLKEICEHYNLRKTGNKGQLRDRCYSYLKLSKATLAVQSTYRGMLQRDLNKLRGPAYFKRSLCTNDTDFVSFDEINEISPDQFLSYRDEKGLVWGFDIMSIQTHLSKNADAANPYNRELLPKHKLNTDIDRILRLSKMLGKDVDIDFQDAVISPEDIEGRARALFAEIDEISEVFTDYNWMFCLNKQPLLDFYRALHDIWTYRANIPQPLMQAICPPVGRPFVGFYWNELVAGSREYVLTEVIRLSQVISTTALDRENKQLGAYYVLSALTLVNSEAATALPWLYQSVA